MSDQEKMEACYRQMYRGMVEKDERVLAEALDDSFVLLHMTGMRQSKQGFIQAVLDGTLNYDSARHEHIAASDLFEDRAELVGQSVVSAAVFGGVRHTWRLQLRCKLRRENDTWKITEAKASTY